MAATTESDVGSRVAAVRVELPRFDARDVDIWLLMCDNLLRDAGIRRQETMFRKLLAQLPPENFRMVKYLVVQQALPDDCFDQLKDCLRRRLARAPAEQLHKLEQLLCKLGDMKPSHLYTQLEILYPDDVDRPLQCIHKMQLFSVCSRLLKTRCYLLYRCEFPWKRRLTLPHNPSEKNFESANL